MCCKRKAARVEPTDESLELKADLECKTRENTELKARIKSYECEARETTELKAKVKLHEAEAQEIPDLKARIKAYESEAQEIQELKARIKSHECETLEIPELKARIKAYECEVLEIPELKARIKFYESRAEEGIQTSIPDDISLKAVQSAGTQTVQSVGVQVSPDDFDDIKESGSQQPMEYDPGEYDDDDDYHTLPEMQETQVISRNLPHEEEDTLESCSESEFNAFAMYFMDEWRKSPGTVLTSLTKALRMPSDNPHTNLHSLHQAWIRARKRYADRFGADGILVLLSLLYTQETSNVDELVGFPKGHHAQNVPAPYVVMNLATRLVAGTQRKSNQWPQDKEEAMEPFRHWVKSVACLTAAAADLTMPSVLDDIQDMRVRRVLSKKRAEEALQSILQGPVLLPSQAFEQVDMISGPCLFSGMGLDEETFERVVATTRADETFFFCALKSMSLCPSVAIEFAKQSTHHKKVLVVLEGAAYGLALWHCSEYPAEMEVLLPGLSKCRVLCDPLPITLFGCDVTMLRLAYVGSGLDANFLQLVRCAEKFDDDTLTNMSRIQQENIANNELWLAMAGTDLDALEKLIEGAEAAGVHAAVVEAAIQKLSDEKMKRQTVRETFDLHSTLRSTGSFFNPSVKAPSLTRSISEPARSSREGFDAEVDFVRLSPLSKASMDMVKEVAESSDEDVSAVEVHENKVCLQAGLSEEDQQRHRELLARLKAACEQLRPPAEEEHNEEDDEDGMSSECASDEEEKTLAQVKPVEVNIRIRQHIPGMDSDEPGPTVGEPIGGLHVVNVPKETSNKYRYHRVIYGGDQGTFHEQSVSPVLDRVLAGYNACFLAYGQTGSGKTYTMVGKNGSDRGVIPRSLDYLASNVPAHSSVRMAIIEFYKSTDTNGKTHEVRDLIASTGSVCIHQYESQAKRAGDGLCNVTGIAIKGLPPPHENPEDFTETAVALMVAASKKRVVRAQKMNDESSRGHLVVMFEITQNGRSSLLYFLDLAGSENVKKSDVTGTGFEEARNINIALYNLRIVVGQLAEKKAVAWRNHKLTIFLKPFLGGSAYLHLICTLRPDGSNLSDTLNTMRFALNAMAINNKPKKNNRGMSLEQALAQLEDREKEVKSLKKQLKLLKKDKSLRGWYPDQALVQVMADALTEYEELLQPNEGLTKHPELNDTCESIIDVDASDLQRESSEIS